MTVVRRWQLRGAERGRFSASGIPLETPRNVPAFPALHATLLMLFALSSPALAAQPIDDRDVPVEIDFASCTPVEERVYVAFGSTTYQIVGPSRHGCVMLYGGEVENRTWNGFLDRTCIVPSTVSRLAFPRTPEGVDLSAIEQYCTETPRP